MITTRNRLFRPAALFAVVGLLAGIVIPLARTNSVYAAQVTSRSIQMSRSTPGATGVTYKVTFTSVATAQSLVVDFCDESPIIGQTCTLPAGMVLTGVTTPTANWTITAPTGSNTYVKLSRSTSWGAAQTITFEIAGITNTTKTVPTPSFYARIYTFTGTTQGSYASPTNVGAHVDDGGIALSTAVDITVTATVMETLTFCTSKVAPGAGCTGTTAPDVVVGKGTPKALDTAAVDGTATDTAYAQLSTNATSGAIINLKTVSSTTCAGLSRDSGTTCEIAAKGAFGPIAAFAGQFGVNVANGTGGTGTVTANANYGTTANSFGMANAVYSTYGDTIASSAGPVSNVNVLLTYGANASATTPAGVYRTTESLIATGTF